MLLDDAVEIAPVRPLMLEAKLQREFEQRVADSSTLAFRVALAVLRQREDAEDVAQEAFLRAHRAFASLRERDRFRAWLVRTTFRLALDHQRGRTRRQCREDAFTQVGPPVASVDDELARRELRQAVGRAVDALPEKQRIVMVLAAIEGQDLRTVARLLALPEGTVKSRLYGARKALAESLRCLVDDTGRR